ncbi:MAG TPA: NCS1 family nucleobase:cation symporter-1 [Microbacteriaceae bacterium]
MTNIPDGFSSRLYNKDIAPRSGVGKWGTWELFAWWMSAWHSLGGYAFAVGLIVLGINGWQMAVGLSLGIVIIYFMSNLMGVAGQKVGVPFPVFARASFGVFGANIPALLRAIVAIFWYGIQTWLASAVIMILVVKLWPATEPMAKGDFLGLSGLGWICFLFLWAVQLLVLHRGIETVRKLTVFAGPAIWVAMAALAIWTLNRAGWSLDWNYHEAGASQNFGALFVATCAAMFITVAYMAGPMLNFADFTRLSPSRRAVIRGNALGLLLNGIAFGVVSIVIALASVKVYGKAIQDPILLLKDIDNPTLLLLTIIVVVIATAGINVILNFVSPSYDISNAAPKHISFRRGGLITAVLAIVVTPWNLYSNPVVVNQFIGGVGALMGPLLGIVLVDYYLIRKAQIHAASLYSDAPDGRYFYRRGANMNSVIALIISGVITLTITFVPALSSLAPFAWPIGVILGGVFCLWTNRMRPNVHARAADLADEANAPDTADEVGV